MAYTPKNATGALFKNDKGDNAARPDYRGDAMVNGELVEIAAWIKPLPSDASKRYMSLSFKPKQAQQAAPAPRQESRQAPARSNAGGFADMDSDIPFTDPLKNRAYSLCV
jgi:hypothetical protein